MTTLTVRVFPLRIMTVSLQLFDDYITSHGLLTHYFYKQKWNRGELTHEELAQYAKEYFHLVKAVPGIVARVRDRAEERGMMALSKEIEKNVEEETQHIELWKRFVGSLGVTEKELESYVPHALTEEAVSDLQTLADGDLEDGVTAMYAMELTLPAIAKSKKEGLCTFYGLKTDGAHAYFDQHLNEEEHFAVWRKIQVDPVRAMQVTKSSLHAQHKLLDGVCEVCGFCISCT